MSLTQKIVDEGKKRLLNPTVLRWVSDDRVMRAAQGLFDARSRVKAAWSILKNGHELPNIDPALDDGPGEVTARESTRVRIEASDSGARGQKRTNGSAATVREAGSTDMDESLRERNTLASIGGRDVFDKCFKFMAADNARKMGIYPYFRPLD